MATEIPNQILKDAKWAIQTLSEVARTLRMPGNNIRDLPAHAAWIMEKLDKHEEHDRKRKSLRIFGT